MTAAAALSARTVVDRGSFRLDASIDVASGRTVAVVGPNGAGKSTLLRALCGLLPLTDGHVTVDGRDVTHADPSRRSIGVVFQDLRLFPHLSALDNVAFGLRSHRATRRSAAARASDWLARLGVADVGGLRPGALSGGQAQRVALARALAVEPRVLLLDEPLSALDATARTETRRELQRHLAAHDGARVVITHDPSEAALLGDDLVVVEGGRVVQRGDLAALAAAPRTAYVADLVGVNRLVGTGSGSSIVLSGGTTVATATAVSGAAAAVVHPRAVALHADQPVGSPRNVWPCVVAGVERLDGTARVLLTGGVEIVAEVTAEAAAELRLTPGTAVWASVKATEIGVIPL